jgi:arylsulfatase A-like enzyme
VSRKRAVVVICDSLRRDLISPANSPLLVDLAAQSTWFEDVSSVFPSTTRVSSACIATGCQPGRHGLLGNCMLLEESDGLHNYSVGNPAFREHLRAVTGRTLHVPTLAQRLAEHGGARIYSNVSPGAAYFNDPDAYGHVYHRAGSYGPGHVPHTGDEALNIASGAAGDAEMTERFCAMLLADDAPTLATLWLSEPDHSGHGQALGSPEHLRAIGHAEACLARVLESVAQLRERGEDVLLLVGSDHGMETVLGEIDVEQALVDAGLKDGKDSRDVVVAPNGTSFVLGVMPEAAARIPAIIDFIQGQPWCGELFHGEALAGIGMPHGVSTSTLAVTMKHESQANAHGISGASWIVADRADPKSYDGRGQHGGLGANEQAPFLIIQGGGFGAGRIEPHSVSLIDYAPTILRHLGLPDHDMDGQAIPLPGAIN